MSGTIFSKKIVLAGCGGMARAWVEDALAREGAELVGFVDLHLASAEAMAARYGVNVPCFTDLKEAVTSTGADLVYDVTIPDSHCEVVTTALRLGCDVLGEKPMANTLAEAREMAACAAATGRRYAVMQNRRYLRQIRQFRELVAGGTIGQPGFVCADFFLGPHFGGFRDAMEHPLLLDMAIHTFDQARFLTGADPISVYAHAFNPPGSWYAGAAAAVCLFEMEGGRVFSYRGSWCAEGAPTSWEAAWRITGSKGTAIWSGSEPPFAEVAMVAAEPTFMREYKRVEATAETWQGREGHFGCLDEMYAALREGRPAETDCADNLKSMAMVFGAMESARLGRKVTMAELLG